MSNRFIRRLALAVAAAGMLLTTACAAKTAAPEAVESSPAQPTVSAIAAAPTPEASASRSPGLKPPATSRNCLGAVWYTVDAGKPGPTSTCVAIGAVVTINDFGPEQIEIDQRDKVSCFHYEATFPCRLISTGTVRFKIYHPDRAWTLTVTVVNASSPPKASPACTKAGPSTVDVFVDNGRFAKCVQVGSVMRLEGLKPEGFTAGPSNAVTCTREPTVAECRFLKVATVSFTFEPTGYYNLAVVVIA